MTAFAKICWSPASRGGEELFQHGQSDQAEIAFEKALALAPDHPTVKLIAASHQYRQATFSTHGGDYQTAMAKIERAIAIAPDIGEAVPCFERIITMAIGQPCRDRSFIERLLVQFRIVAHNIDQIDEFIAFLKSVLFIGENDPNAELISCWCTVAGRELMRSDGYFHYHYGTDAISFLERALVLSPANVDAYRYLGMCLTRVNQYASAVENFRISLALNPDQLDPFYSNESGLGLAYHHMGQSAQAAQTYRTLLERFAVYPPAYEYVRVEAARLQAWTLQQPAPQTDEFHFRLADYAAQKRGWNRPISDGKKTVRVLCFGKCNAQAIGLFLHTAQAGRIDLRTIPVWSEDICRTQHDIARYTGQSDVVIYQDFAIFSGADNVTLINNQKALAAEMEKYPSLVKIDYPYIENSAFWSIFVRAADQMPVTGKAVREMLESERDIEEIIALYDAGQLDFGFAKRTKEAMSNLKFVERGTDIKVHDFIQANLKRKRLFLDPNHPTKEVWVEITRQVCALLAERNLIAATPDLSSLYANWSNEVPYEGVGNPIDRYSKNHFEFDWGPIEDSPALTAYYHRPLHYAKARLGYFSPFLWR